MFIAGLGPNTHERVSDSVEHGLLHGQQLRGQQLLGERRVRYVSLFAVRCSCAVHQSL